MTPDEVAAATIIALLLDEATRDNPGVILTARGWLDNHDPDKQ